MIKCSQCGGEFGSGEMKGCAAAISGSMMGDECTESYFFCERCGVYTVEIFYDPFAGEETTRVEGPVSRAKGDTAIGLIKRCPEPWNKKCRCEAHRSYFEGWLD